MKHSVQINTCPKCQQLYYGVPSISRADNKTRICPDCGTREALESLGITPKEQEEIIKTIHKYS